MPRWPGYIDIAAVFDSVGGWSHGCKHALAPSGVAQHEIKSQCGLP